MTGGSAQRRGEWLAAAGDPDAARWFAGAEGERRVADALSALPEDWTVLHDRLLMPGLTESNLDHLAIGPPGVVLIDAKNFSGDITVWQNSLYQHLGTRERRTSRNLVGELGKVHWMAVQASARLGVPVTPVLALAGNRHAYFGEPQLVRGVWVVPINVLLAQLTALPGRLDPEAVRRLRPRVMSEFPSTETDPELLAAIGHELRRTPSAPRPVQERCGTRPAPATGPRPTTRAPRRSRRRRRPLLRLLRFAVLTGLLLLAASHASLVMPGIGAVLGAVFERPPDPGHAPLAQPVPAADAAPGVAPSHGLQCEALSAERLSTYVTTPVSAQHSGDGACRWVSDPSDPRSVILTAEQISPRWVSHLTEDTVSLTAYASLDPPGPTSVLLAREGQWIPVADTRTAARWPLRMEIHRGPLGIDDHRGRQILRAAAADLNAATG